MSFGKILTLKEIEIVGIIESEYPFYGHFRLEHGVGVPNSTYGLHTYGVQIVNNNCIVIVIDLLLRISWNRNAEDTS